VDRPIASVEQPTRAAMTLIEVRDIESANELHRSAERVLARRGYHEVDMVGHQRVGVNPDADNLGCTAQGSEKYLAIDLMLKDVAAIVSALYDV
jgi:hypothetical protein